MDPPRASPGPNQPFSLLPPPHLPSPLTSPPPGECSLRSHNEPPRLHGPRHWQLAFSQHLSRSSLLLLKCLMESSLLVRLCFPWNGYVIRLLQIWLSTPPPAPRTHGTSLTHAFARMLTSPVLGAVCPLSAAPVEPSGSPPALLPWPLKSLFFFF